MTMGPLTTLLTLPVSGPMAGLTWIARQIANAAMQELLDPTRIETALLVLERRLEEGKIDEATFEAEEERLLEELAEITALRAAEAEGAEEAEAEGEAETDLPPPAAQAAEELAPADPAQLAPREATADRPDPVGQGSAGTLRATPSGVANPHQEAEAWTLA